MKAIIRYYHDWEVPELYRFTSLPLLDMTIHGAPHKRQHRKVLQLYREELYTLAFRRWADKITLPIDWPVGLRVLFTNPNSPDLDHLIEALYMAVDGKTLEGPAIMTDDRHIQALQASKIYSNAPTKRDGMR